jgi:hypothetical protein
MLIEAERGALRIVVSRRFGAADVSRIREAHSTFGPVSALIMDFSGLGEDGDTELALIASLLNSLPPGAATIRGLTMRQSQTLLEFLDGIHDRVAA